MSRREKFGKRGQSLVEFAILLPFMLLILLGAADFGRVCYWAITLSHAARAGAGYGAQSTGTAVDSSGIQLAAQQEAQNIGSISVSSRQICECPGDSNASCTDVCPDGSGAARVSIEVTAGKTFQTLFQYPGIPNIIPLSRTATLRVQ